MYIVPRLDSNSPKYEKYLSIYTSYTDDTAIVWHMKHIYLCSLLTNQTGIVGNMKHIYLCNCTSIIQRLCSASPEMEHIHLCTLHTGYAVMAWNMKHIFLICTYLRRSSYTLGICTCCQLSCYVYFTATNVYVRVQFQSTPFDKNICSAFYVPSLLDKYSASAVVEIICRVLVINMRGACLQQSLHSFIIVQVLKKNHIGTENTMYNIKMTYSTNFSI